MRESAIETLRAEPRDRFDVGVSILAVITTLVAAFVGILFAVSSNESEEATSTALRKALAAAKGTDLAIQLADRELALLEERRELAAQARVAQERRLLASGDDAKGLAAEEARSRAIVRRLDQSLRDMAPSPLLDISPAGGGAPERELFFPYNLRQRTQERSLEQVALRDAANSESSEWSKRSASYGAILTLLAVTLYLFGFALTPQGRNMRGLFAAVGLALLVVCIIFGPIRALSPPRPAPADAARSYADGIVRLSIATTREDYKLAAQDLTRAIRLRPDFADAYAQRSDAIFRAHSPQNVTFASLTTPAALLRVINDTRMSRALGVTTPETTGSLGFYLVVLGLLSDDPSLLGKSVALSRTAVAEDRNEPVYQYNLGLALLAAGEMEEAREAYEKGTTMVVRQQAHPLYTEWISGALTDLELLTAYGSPETLLPAQEMRGILTAAFERVRLGDLPDDAPRADILAPADSDASVSAARAAIGPGFAEFDIEEFEGLEEGDRIAAEWYHSAAKGVVSWSNLPALSRSKPLGAGPEPHFSTRYLTPTRQCLPAGRYRVDLYQDGELLTQAETEYEGGFESFVNHDIGVMGCVPAGPDGVGWDGGAERGTSIRRYLSPDRRSGLVLVRLDTVEAPPYVGRRIALHLIQPVLELVGDRFFPYSAFRGTVPYTFLQGRSGARLHYRYPGGVVVAGVAGDTDGSLVAALAFGPRGGGSLSERHDIISSLEMLSDAAAPAD